MRADRNRVEGQIDLFEAMNRAAEAVDRMVQEEKSGRSRKKSSNQTSSLPRKDTENAMQPKQPGQAEKIIRGCDMRACLQRTFLNPGDGDFATVAYMDYHMVYTKEWNSPVSLRKFDNSKEAVDYYIKQLEKIRQVSGIEPTQEHEPFADVKYVMENLYTECE